MKNHDVNLDLLRVAAAFAVVWLHTSAVVVVTSPNIYNTAWWVGNLYDALSRWCVPIFIMVSGALLLSRDAESDVISFYRRRTARLLPPIVFWTAFYIYFQTLINYNITAIAVTRAIVEGRPYYHLWYLYMISGLYLITPFLRQIVIASSARVLLLFIAGAFVIASIETSLVHLTGHQDITTFLSSFLPYVAYFVAGHYLYAQANRASKKSYLLVAIVGGVLVAFGTGALLTTLGPKSWKIMYSYLNPIVIVMSLCIFRFGLSFQFRSGKAQVLIRRIAPITLGIYVIHPFWLVVLSNLGLKPFLVHPMLGIPLTSIVAFGLSALSASLLAKIPFLRATVR
jgi:surface polysaccharide O-acyltransferase-like enzyme